MVTRVADEDVNVLFEAITEIWRSGQWGDEGIYLSEFRLEPRLGDPYARAMMRIEAELLPHDLMPLLPNQTLGNKVILTKYDGNMSVQEYLVSASGQMSLPAGARHRWNLDEGGPVDVIDLGFGVLTVPKGTGKKLLNDLLGRDDHAEFVRSLAEDPDLATS